MNSWTSDLHSTPHVNGSISTARSDCLVSNCQCLWIEDVNLLILYNNWFINTLVKLFSIKLSWQLIDYSWVCSSLPMLVLFRCNSSVYSEWFCINYILVPGNHNYNIVVYNSNSSSSTVQEQRGLASGRRCSLHCLVVRSQTGWDDLKHGEICQCGTWIEGEIKTLYIPMKPLV